MPKKILIVDDDPSTRKLVQSILESSGYEVATAEDGREALPAIKNHHPDAIIMDLIMKDVGGSKAVEALQADEKAKKIPILFLTSVNASDEHQQASFNVQVGTITYKTMTKPFRTAALLKELRALLSQKKLAGDTT